MARPRLAPGTYSEHPPTPLVLVDGKWRVLHPSNGRSPKPETVAKWRARATYRTTSGVRKDISVQVRGGRRIKEVQADADRLIQERISAETRGRVHTGLTKDTPILDAGEAWLTYLEQRTARSAATKRLYRGSLRTHFAGPSSTIAGLTLAQVNKAPVLRTFLEGVADAHGAGSAKTARSVLSGILDFAVRDEALEASDLKRVGRVQASSPHSRQKRNTKEARDTSRAFTPDEREQVLAYVDEQASAEGLNPRTARKLQAVADLTHFMLRSGVRIGEARRLRWEHIDLDAGTVDVPGTKTVASARLLVLPPAAIERLRARAERTGAEGYVFAAPNGNDPERMWDQSNASNAMSGAIRGAGFEWATSHTMRRTVATMIVQALPPNHAADFLGHTDVSTTLKHYMGRDPRRADPGPSTIL